MPEKVVILGGGVAGMSAAHELIERGYEVEVFERQIIAGGKARSIPVLEGEPDHGSKERHIRALREWVDVDGFDLPPGARRPWLPGEHGFRFFPNFYRHIVDTMARTPFYDKGTCADNLVDTTQALVSLYDKAGIVLPERFPRDLMEVTNAIKTFLFAISPRDPIPFDEIEHFAGCIWRIMTSCKERRFDEYERVGWWEFIGAEKRTKSYQKFLAIGITRSLVAAKARTASTKTIGDIFLQLLFGIIAPYPGSNRLLNGPTNLAWIQPWLEYLRGKGVVYNFECTVKDIHCRAGRIVGATIERSGKTEEVTGDWFIGALPVERMAPLITEEMKDIDPGLGRLIPLARNVQWMNGIQFYLTRDVPLTNGHVILIDSEWALTAVSQRQFWPDIDFKKWGDGKTKGLISVDISEWDKPGLNGKTARACSRAEIADQVWEQMKKSFNVDGQVLLRDEDVHFWFLDPDIIPDPADPARAENVEPLLVNRVNTWRLRPAAATLIQNFFLASDYVRTYTDLATMEGANEAARWAVNALLDRSGSKAERCKIWDLHEPEALKPLRAYDKARYDAGLPWDDRFAIAAEATLRMAQSEIGMDEGGQGPLSIVAPFAAEASKPGGVLDNPVVFDALQMIGPPKGTIGEIAKALPGLMDPLPGEPLEDLAAEAVAGPAGAIATESWSSEFFNAGPNIASRPEDERASPIGKRVAAGRPSTSAMTRAGDTRKRLKVVQKD